MCVDWNKLADHLCRKCKIPPVRCLVLGSTDTGKTTLVTKLAQQIACLTRVAVIDADIGQSHIGPPTTIGWALIDPDMTDLASLEVQRIFFIGSVAPTGHLLPMTVGIHQACQDAQPQASVILIDTGGYIRDAAARALWWHVHQLIQPQVVVAVQQQDELESILQGIEKLSSEVIRMASDPNVQSKSPDQRRRFRQERFAAYFAQPQTYALNLNDVSIQASQPRGNLLFETLQSHLIALRDQQGVDQALGIITQWNSENNTLQFLSPIVDLDTIRCVVLGDIRLEGDELPL